MDNINSLKWAIYYSDGTIFSYLDGGPEDAPCIGVQFIAQEKGNGDILALSSFDYYYWDKRGKSDKGDGRWWCSDIVGYMLYMMRPGWKKVLFGEWIGDEEYEEISRQIAKDIQFIRDKNITPWGRKQ